MAKAPHDHTAADKNAMENKDMPGAYPADMFSKILHSKEFEEILHILVPEVINRWAGVSVARKTVSRPIKSHILKSFTRSSGQSPSLFKNPDLTRNLLESIPASLDAVIKSVHEVSKTIEALPAWDKEEIIGKMLSNMNGAETGAILTRAVRIINEIHKTHPTFFADHFKAPFEKWVENVDFGEIKDFADNVGPDILALVKNANDALWNYPAKPVLLATLIPGIVNLVLGVFQDTVVRFNNFPPDLLTDVLLSMFRDLDGRNIGMFVNELSEFVRKSHTGSALIGDTSSPKFPDDLSRLLEEILNTIDVKLLWKGLDAVRDGRGSINKVWLDLLKDHPEMVVEMLKRYPSALNSVINGMNRKVALVEALSEEEVAEVAQEEISAIDVSDFADTINMLCMTANGIRKQKPDIITSMISQFVNSLDLFELEDTLKWVAKDVLDEFKPVGRLIAPQIVLMLSEWLAPDENDDGYDEETEKALNALQARLLNREGRS
jgi:hypothetical protein